MEKATVGYYPGALISMPALVASEQKFFEKNGLNAEPVPVASGPAMTRLAPAGSATRQQLLGQLYPGGGRQGPAGVRAVTVFIVNESCSP